jgi:hypothetical protein
LESISKMLAEVKAGATLPEGFSLWQSSANITPFGAYE